MMIEVTDIQIKVLSLFRHDPNKSFGFASIKAIATGLAEQHFKDESITAVQAPYRFFLPLVRMGLIEFVGRGKYQLSPTVLLRRKREYALVNGYESLCEEVSILAPNATCDPFGVLRFSLDESSALDSIVLRHNILFSIPNVLGHLQNMKRMEEIVLGWEEYLPTNTVGFQCFAGTQGWKPFRDPVPGSIVGNSNPGGKRYIIDSNGAYHRIPNSKDHPDAFNIAVCASRSIQRHPMSVKHDGLKQRMTLEDHFYLPINVDRLLRIHNIFDNVGGLASHENGIKAYGGSAQMAAQLNRILN